MIGEYLPIVSLSHQYLITDDIPELVSRGSGAPAPACAIPTSATTCARSGTGCCSDPMRRSRAHTGLRVCPSEFAHQLFDDDLERLAAYIDAACARLPMLGSVGVKRVINGPIPYAPDGNPLMGPATECAQLLPLLRLHVRHRTGRRCRSRHRRMGRQRRAGLGRLAPRCAPLSAVRRQVLRTRQGARDLSERIRGRLIRRRSVRRAVRRRSLRSTSACRPRARCSARAAAGSARCITPAGRPGRAGRARFADRTGTVRSRVNAPRSPTASRCWICPVLPSSGSRVRVRLAGSIT